MPNLTLNQKTAMKRRYLYVLLFGVPALLASTIISLLLSGAAAGILWIFVFGDSPWPPSAGNMLTVMLVFTSVTLSVAFMSAAYVFGKKQEEQAALNVKHVMASAGATALLVLLVVSQQWLVGNIGTKSDDVLCSEFCRDQGFTGSGRPPRDAGAATCSCYDVQGREAVKVSMRDVVAGESKLECFRKKVH
ncbi:MAG: hypothetical protein HY892_04660 [Deltaproteobacteria bacterium]|nr:hypothetical protein [Deltaproteobacteria bacterium]